MSKPILIVMVGLSNSGKSTWTHSLSEEFSIPIVEPDSIRMAIHGQEYLPSAEPYIWLTAHTMVDSLFLTGYTAVILDSTQTQGRFRREWMSKKWNTVFIHASTPMEVCLERAEKDGRLHLLPVIRNMAKGFQGPNDQEKHKWYDWNDVAISKNQKGEILIAGKTYAETHKEQIRY